MTRKSYYHKGMNLVIAINKKYNPNMSTGNALAHFRDHHREAAQHFGSYEKAWNCDAMKSARRIFLGEDC